MESLVQSYLDYSEPLPMRVAIGTYNINGGKHFRSIVFKDLSLSDWLLDAHKTEKGSGMSLRILIHSTDPQSRLVDHYFHTCRTSVRPPTFQELAKLNKF